MKKLSAILFAILLAVPLFSQDVVNWSSSVMQTGTAGVYRLTYKAAISKGYHIYDLQQAQDGPLATSISFEMPSDRSFELVGEVIADTPGRVELDKVFGMTVTTFEDSVVFHQDIRLNAECACVVAEIEWMACTGGACTMPQQISITDNVGPAAATSAAKAAAAEAAGNAGVTGPAETAGPAAATNATEAAATEATATEGAGNAGVTGPAAAANAAKAAATEAAAAAEGAGNAEVTGNAGVIGPAEAENGGKPFHQGTGNIWGLILAAMLWGLAAIVTPCVFPMVPLTVSFFLRNSDKRKSTLNAVLYGVFIVLLYTLPISVIILITRIAGGDAVTADIFNFLSTHWIPNLLFFTVFMVFAASLFGAFEIELPSNLVNKSDRRSSAGGIGGVFFLALTLVLVSFSCTGPIVGTVLIQSTGGQFWAPIVTIAVFSFVFALPFVLLALFPGMLKNLPKSGGWLNSVKVALGFVEIALGLKFFSVADQVYHWGILDRGLYLIIWIVCAILLGLYFAGVISFKYDSKPRKAGVAGIMISAVSFLFAAYLATGLWGAPLKALSGYLPPIESQRITFGERKRVSQDNAKGFDYGLRMPLGLDGYFNLEEAMDASRNEGKPLFISITGHGCVNCREMESRVWSNPEVYRLLDESFVICLLYTDDKLELPQDKWITDNGGRVLKTMGRINSHIAVEKFGAASQPFYIILAPDGRKISDPWGYDLDASKFSSRLKHSIDMLEDID